MRQRWCVWLWVVVLGAMGVAAQDSGGRKAGEQFIGTWTGTWEGAGSSGSFELVLERDTGKKDAIAGRVSVGGEPTYKATLAQLSIDGKKLAASYDFPPEPAVEIRLACTFDGETATGTWTAVEKASGNEAVSGTWTVKRK